MNLTDYTYLLNRPDAITDRHTESLERIVSEFPYFQSARALRLKGLYNQNSFQYNYALKVTAAYTTDRSVLFDFITSDTFTAIHKGLYEQKLAELHDIDVKGSEVVHSQSDAEKVEQSILTSIREAAIPFSPEPTPEKQIIIQEEIIAPEPVLPEEITPEDNSDVTVDIPVISITPETTEFREEKLDIGKPLEFTKSETHSFSEWLQLSSFQPINREEAPTPPQEPLAEVVTEDPEKAKKNEIIDRFIQANPKIPQIKSDMPPPVVAEPSKEENLVLMTETLARVYLEQKKYQKAIQAYEILILKYPEKSIFFADRISEIKKLQQNINQQ